MEFINEQVAIKELPKIESIVLSPLQPLYLTSLRIQYFIFSLVVLAAFVLAFFLVPLLHSPLNRFAISAGWLILFVTGWWLEVKSFQSKGFAIREKDIIYRSGWILRHTSICPFNRIQHCSVSSGPIDRKYGLATLRVYTAGSEGDLRIPGLPEEQAFSIKQFITQKIVNDDQPGN
jgi:uncharacterized protein